MATLNAINTTILDIKKRLDPDGGIADIVEVLHETNDILQDATMMEGNLPTGNRTTIRTGLPDVYWRLINQGVPASKSRTAQVTDACGMLSAFSKPDRDLIDMSSEPARARFTEDVAFLEAFNQKVATTLFYGNTDTDPEQFLGLAPRYSALSGVENADNIIDAGGNDADNTSVWLINWHPNTCFMMYPKDSKTAGFSQEDLGVDRVQDGDGNDYMAYVTHYGWKVGLVLKDWRHVVRIANIKTGALTKGAATGADLIDLFQQAMHIPPRGMGRPVFYVNRTIYSFLARQLSNKSNVWLSWDQVGDGGKRQMSFGGIPIRQCDSILNTEDDLT